MGIELLDKYYKLSKYRILQAQLATTDAATATATATTTEND
jgi:hypothetical protein